MAEVTQLVLAVDSRQVRNASGDLDRFGKAGQRAEKETTKLTAGFRGLSTAAAGVAGSLAVRAIIQAADGYKNLNARLQLVSRTTAEFAKAQAEVLNIAQRSGVALQQTGDLYASLSRSTQSLGVSQDELLGVTESINQALIISGTSAQGAQAALVQLGQGFAAGALRGEELNSVLEQAPRLAQAIADGLGVPIGKLRELGQEGALTAEKVFGALQGSSARLKAEFDTIPLTVERATTQAANALSVLIGSLDESTGASSALAEGIGLAAQAITEFAGELRRASNGAEDIGFLARAFTTVSQAVRVLLSDVVFVFKGIGREIGAVAAQLAALGRGDFAGFRAISDAVKADAARARAELDKYQQQVLNPFLNSRGRGTTGGPDPRLIGTTPANETVGFRPRASGGGGGGGRGGRAPREQVNEAEKYLEALRRQLEATVDLSAQDELLRDIQLGRLGKVTPAQEQQLLAIAKQIDGFKALQAEEEAQAKRNAEALEERNRVLDEGRAIYEATRTPLENLAAETDRLNKLLQAGAIDWDTYSRAIFAAQDQFDQINEKADKTGAELDKFAERAAENIQTALGDELTNILEGDFDNIGRSFTKLLNRMVAEAAAAEIAKSLGLGGGSGGGGGFLGDLLKTGISFFTGTPGRAIGGPVSAGGLYRVNERRPEVLDVAGKQFLMMGSQGGSVSDSAGGGGQTIQVNNNFTVGNNVDRRTQLEIARMAGAAVQRATARNG
jgi:tape measure domain-containing protein